MISVSPALVKNMASLRPATAAIITRSLQTSTPHVILTLLPNLLVLELQLLVVPVQVLVLEQFLEVLSSDMRETHLSNNLSSHMLSWDLPCLKPWVFSVLWSLS